MVLVLENQYRCGHNWMYLTRGYCLSNEILCDAMSRPEQEIRLRRLCYTRKHVYVTRAWYKRRTQKLDTSMWCLSDYTSNGVWHTVVAYREVPFGKKWPRLCCVLIGHFLYIGMQMRQMLYHNVRHAVRIQNLYQAWFSRSHTSRYQESSCYCLVCCAGFVVQMRK